MPNPALATLSAAAIRLPLPAPQLPGRWPCLPIFTLARLDGSRSRPHVPSWQQPPLSGSASLWSAAAR
ncbi:MAG: hypothetical protein ACO3JJ_03530 [Opitutaceae bacterium]